MVDSTTKGESSHSDNDVHLTGRVVTLSRSHSNQAILARTGKRQVLKRRFGVLSIFGFSCSILITWESALTTPARTGLLNGGTVGVLGQFLLAWIGSLSTFVVIGELASIAPTAGGQYHWVAMLSPRPVRKFLSYLTGWMTCLSWIATIAGGASIFITMVSALCLLEDPHYAQISAPYQNTLASWGVVLLGLFCNTVIGNRLPFLEGIFLIVHIMGFFGILIPLLYYSPKLTPSEVFGGSAGHENAGWPTYGLSFMVGASGSAWTFAGADAAVHMSEEIFQAAINVPRTIIAAVLLNGLMGLSMLIALWFCTPNLQQAVDVAKAGSYPFIEIFYSVTGSKGGTAAMTGIVIFMDFVCTVGFIAASSRIVWSFARDRGLPFSSYLTRISKRTRIPTLAVLVTSVIPCLLVLLNLAPSTVFNALLTLGLSGSYSTYFISCCLLLYHRTYGTICPHDSDETLDPAVNVPSDSDPIEYRLSWGPWHLKGLFGTLNNAFACCYTFVFFVFSFMPATTPTTLEDMNWTCVIFGFTVMVCVADYIVRGRKQYIGPIVELAI